MILNRHSENEIILGGGIMTVKNSRAKTGKLITKFIREISEEQTEHLRDDNGVIDDKMATKAEALARLLWRMALGKPEFVEDPESKGTIALERRPDKGAMSQIIERLEGKVPAAINDDSGKRSVADRVTEQGTKRINAINDPD